MFDAATNAASTPVVPEDRYVIECLALEEAPPFDPTKSDKTGIRWILGLYDPNTGERFKFQNADYEFFQTTTSNMSPGARARQYAEAFLGREIAEGEKVDPRNILGRKCVGVVIHEFSRNDKTKKVAKLASVKPYSNGAAKPSAAPSAPKADDVEVAREALRKKIRQAEVLQSPQHLTWISLRVDTMDAAECAEFMAMVQADIDNG